MERGVALLASWGLSVEVAPSAFTGHVSGFLAADDAARAADLNAALADPSIAGVVCIRGGYGSQRIIDMLDVTPLRDAPKVVAGFSDITAVHLAIGQRADLATLHSPMLEWNPGRLDDTSAESLRRALMGGQHEVITGEPLVGGRVTAPLVGGNLTLLSTLCGTPDQPDARGRVLFCEDLEESPYRMDRALVQLRRAGVLDEVAGMVFDDFTDSLGPDGQWTVRDVAAHHAEALGVPAVWGLPIGHGRAQRTVVLGADVTVDGDRGTLSLNQSG